MVIVDSPGIGDSEQVNKITLSYLPRAYAFIYVLNTSNAGGLQEDRVSEKNKQYSPPPPPIKYFKQRTSRLGSGSLCCVKDTSLSQCRHSLRPKE